MCWWPCISLSQDMSCHAGWISWVTASSSPGIHTMQVQVTACAYSSHEQIYITSKKVPCMRGKVKSVGHKCDKHHFQVKNLIGNNLFCFLGNFSGIHVRVWRETFPDKSLHSLTVPYILKMSFWQANKLTKQM